MKLLPVLALAVVLSACSSTGNITKTERKLPTDERGFVKAIETFDRKAIIADLGEPAKADDVRIKGSNKIVASIWHYHNINKDENGKYYETTELDFIDNKVVQVVFLNNDGSEEAMKKDGMSYEIPKNKQSN
jgi:hypothetical protein